MTGSATGARSFSVRLRGGGYGRVVEESSFEAAAAAFAEGWAPTDGQVGLQLIVRDQRSGHERCYRIDLETGEADACD